MIKKYFLFLFIFLILVLSIDNKKPSNSYYFPTDYLTITSDYGLRELYNMQNFHNGTDFGAPQGTNVYSISSGFVCYVGFMQRLWQHRYYTT